MADSRRVSGSPARRPDRFASNPLGTYVVRWYCYLVGGTFLVMALVFVVAALPLVRSQPGAAAFLLAVALLVGAAGVNGLTLGRLTVYEDGLVYGRGVLLGSRWIARSQIDEITLGRASSAISAPFLIPIVHCSGGKRYKFQSLRGFHRAGHQSAPERIVQQLQRWLGQEAAT